MKRLICLLTVAGVVAPAPARAQEPSMEHMETARRVLETTPLIDGHNDLPWAIRGYEAAPMDVRAYDLTRRTPGHTDIDRLRRGMVGGQFWSIYVPCGAVEEGAARVQLEEFDIALRIFEEHPGVFELALSASDVERVFGEGRIASLLGMEGGHVLENSLGALRAFYDLGARYLTLTHGCNTDWADSATDDPVHGGLTEFGREVVREMNWLGMLVDLSHVAPSTMHDVLDVAEAPVIFSHSSAKALTDHPRNVPDDVLWRLPDNGGVVMVTFVPSFVSSAPREWARERDRVRAELRERFGDQAAVDDALDEWVEENPPPRATLDDVADHIEHVRDVAGVDHVGIGSDYDGISTVPVGLEDVSTFPALFAELARRGWSEDALRKLAGANVLRVMREAEAAARRLQRLRGPSTATIGEVDRRE